MKGRSALVLGFLATGAIVVYLARDRFSPSPAPAQDSPSPGRSGREEAQVSTADIPRATKGYLARAEEAYRGRDWRRLMLLRRTLAQGSPEEIRRLLRSDASVFLLGHLLEPAFRATASTSLRQEIASSIMKRLEGRIPEEFSEQDRSRYLRFLGLYGGEAGRQRLFYYLRDGSADGLRRDAAIALGEFGSDRIIPGLEGLAEGGVSNLAGIYAVQALESMRRRGIGRDGRGTWRGELERGILGGEDPRVVEEALYTFGRIKDQGANRLLVDLLQRPDASDPGIRRCLALLGEHGTEEDLDDLAAFARRGRCATELESTISRIRARLRN